MTLALITGASSGLGKALAYALAEQNIPLILVARNTASIPKDLPVPTQVIACDLTRPTDRLRLTELIHKLRPDLIINNAGIGLYGPFLSHPPDKHQAIIDINISALLEITYESSQALIRADKPGTIVNISSAAAFFSYPTFATYAASKAFVNNFSQALDIELKPHGVRVLTICPGQIDTNFRARASNNHPQKKDSITLSPDKAAQLILKQIAKKKPISIINFRYRVLIALSRFLPNKILSAILQKSLKGRY